MVTVGEVTYKAICDMVLGHLRAYNNKVNQAYEKCEKDLVINFGVKLSPKTADDIDLDVTINFVKERVKATASTIVNEKQDVLPFGDKNGDG